MYETTNPWLLDFVEQKKKKNIQSVPRVENFFLRLEKDYGK